MKTKVYPILLLLAISCKHTPDYRGPFIEPDDAIYQQRHQGKMQPDIAGSLVVMPVVSSVPLFGDWIPDSLLYLSSI